MKRILFTLLLLLCFSILPSSAADKKDIKIPYEKYLLSNGMNVILHVDRSDPIAAVYVAYHVGSAREEKGKTGFAHLFEHLRFNESQDIPQGEWFKKLQTAGASNINGSTNTDRTNYFEVIPKNAVELALWMESDRMGFLLSKFTPETFVTQQNVVQNEKRQGENNPYAQTEYILDKLVYPEGHPYSWEVIGSMEDLASASIEDAIEFHKKYYGPSNATLVVAGDIDVDQTKQWIDRYFAEIPSAPQPTVLPRMQAKITEMKRASYEDNLAVAPQLSMVFASVEDFHNDAYALSFLARILGGTKKSPLYKVLVEERKLAPSVSVRQNSSELAGTFNITVRTFPGVKLGEVEDQIKEAFVRFEKEGFTEADVERQKAGMEYRFYASLASVLGKARRLADHNIFNGSPDYMTTDFQNSMKVTKEDVWRVYNTYVRGKKYVLASIVPKGKSDLAAPQSTPFSIPEEPIDKQGTTKKNAPAMTLAPIPSKIDRTREPLCEADPVVNLPSIWSAKTSNAIPVFGVTQSELPIVQFSIILKGGMLLDNPDRMGTAYLTARLMNEGTKTRTPVELREAIEDLGSTITVSGGEESITLSGSCLASKLAATFALAREILFEPRWDEKEFLLAKSETIESLKRSESAPATIASVVFARLVYGPDNILANQSMGTQKSIDRITIEDLKAYYARSLSPSVARITVVGEVKEDDVITLFDGLRQWKGPDVKLSDVRVSVEPKTGVYFVDVPHARQSVFNVGHLGLRYADSDFYRAVVMNHKLGGDFSGILNMILRESKSFTYGARSTFSGGGYAGLFKASTSVQTNATLETGKIIKEEIALYRDGISPQDFALVKSALLKSDAGRFETLMQLAQMLTPVALYDLPFDYVHQREMTVQEMTPADEKELAQKYLRPENMIYVVVGDKASQLDKLKELGLGEPVLVDREGRPVGK
jgi:zinc protease